MIGNSAAFAVTIMTGCRCCTIDHRHHRRFSSTAAEIFSKTRWGKEVYQARYMTSNTSLYVCGVSMPLAWSSALQIRLQKAMTA